MSGIIGIVTFDGGPADVRLLRAMTGAMRRRGPDGAAVWADGPAGLGAALLRTGPEDGARQPLTLDGSVWAVADARLDGREDLVGDLRARGRPASSAASDAELILHAYAEWGEACLERLFGDFAFALWDAPARRLLCARDQFGVVPFYYATLPRAVVVGNTLDCVLLAPGVGDDLDESAVADYLVCGHGLDPAATFFESVRRLPPAHALTCSDGEVRLRRYWDLAEPEPLDAPDAEVVERFRDLFGRAVADRLRGDRVALSLSGGMDSTSVAATAARLSREGRVAARLHAYSVGFDWLLPDVERYYAGLVADAAGLPVTYLSAERFLLEGGPLGALRVPTEPRFSPRPAPGLAMVGEEIAAGGRVVVSGIGGDPALAPPPQPPPGAGRRAAALLRGLARAPRRTLAAAAAAARLRLAGRRAAGAGDELRAPEWIAPEFAARANVVERLRAVEAAQRTDDRLGMAHLAFWSSALSAGDPDFLGLPIRSRHPFFDVRLVEFLRAAASPERFTNKRLLRDAVAPELPDAVLRRRKTPLKTDLYHALALRGRETWMREAARYPEAASYVDAEWLARAASRPDSVPAAIFSVGVLYPLGLAWWLRHRRRPGLSSLPEPDRVEVLTGAAAAR